MGEQLSEGNTQISSRLLMIVNDVTFYKYELDKKQFSKIGLSCFNNENKVTDKCAIVRDHRGFIYFVGGQRNLKALSDVYRLDLKTMI